MVPIFHRFFCLISVVRTIRHISLSPLNFRMHTKKTILFVVTVKSRNLYSQWLVRIDCFLHLNRDLILVFFLVPEHSTAAVGMYLKSLNNVCRTHVERARNQHNTAASKSQNSRIAFHLKNQQQYRRSKDDETKN